MNRITLIVGETGSGKSTQLVQYLAEELDTEKRIACIQPRKIAIRNVSQRVAEEMQRLD